MSTVSPVDSEREKEVENRLDLGKSKVTSFYIHHGGLPELQVLYIKLQPPKGVAQGLAWLEESLDPTYPLVGLDCELGESSVRLLQLSTRSRCVIIRIPKQVTREAIPPELEAFLGHRTVIKSGVELWGNALDLYRDLGIATNGNLDASFIYSQNQAGHTPSLERLTNQVLGQNAFIRDREISCANWDTKPTKKQLEYAALNAQASFLIGARREVLTQLRPFHISDMSATWLEEVGRLRVEMNANQRKEKEEELPVEYESIELINRRSVKVILKKSSPLIRQGSLMKLYYSNGLKHPCQVLRYEEDSARILLPRGCTTQAFPVSHVCKVTLLHEKQKEQVEFHDKLWQYIRDYLYGNQNQVRRLPGASNTSLVMPLPITPFSPQTYPSTFTPYDESQTLASLETQAPYHPLDSEASSSQLGSEEEQDEERNQSSDTKRELCGSQFPGPSDDDDLNLIENVLKEWEFEEERVKDPMREEKTQWEPSDVITKDKPLKEEQKEEQASGDDTLAALQSSSSPIKGDIVVSSPLARAIQRPKSREGSSNSSLFSPSFSTPFHMLSPRVFPPPFSLPSSPLGDEGVKWVCPKCMVVNPLTSFKCQTCETPIPKLLVAPESLTSKFSVSGRLQQSYPLSSSDVDTESDGISSRRSSMTSSPQEDKDKKDTLSKRKAEKVKSLWDSPDVKAKLVSKIETKDRAARKSTPPSNYKIALCFDFKTRNFCRNGKKCSFAHGLSELRRPQGEAKSEMCSYQKNGEPCPNRESCTLNHDADAPEKGSSEPKIDGEKRQKEADVPSSSPPTSKKMKPRKISLKELEQKPATDSSKEDIVRPLAYKTELCSFYIKLRRCRNGKDCNYAHGEAELRKPDESALPNGGSRLSYKTELCRHWNEKGECWLEEKCKFAHGEGELRKYESDEGKAKLRLRKSDLRIVNNDEASKDKPADYQKKKQPKKEKPKESEVMATLRTMWKGTPTHAPDSNSTGN